MLLRRSGAGQLHGLSGLLSLHKVPVPHRVPVHREVESGQCNIHLPYRSPWIHSSGQGRGGGLSVNPYRLPSSSPWLHPSGREVNHPISTGGSHDSGGIGARCTAAASCDPLGFRGSMTPGQLVFRHSNEARDYIVYVEPVTATSSKCGARGRTAPLTHPPANITLPRDRNGVTSSS